MENHILCVYERPFEIGPYLVKKTLLMVVVTASLGCSMELSRDRPDAAAKFPDISGRDILETDQRFRDLNGADARGETAPPDRSVDFAATMQDQNIKDQGALDLQGTDAPIPDLPGVDAAITKTLVDHTHADFSAPIKNNSIAVRLEP